MKTLTLATLTAALLCGCQPSFRDKFAGGIEKAHAADAWRAQRALAADLVVKLGGKTMLAGSLQFETIGGRSRIDLIDGTSFVFDGKDAWTSPATSTKPMGRFHVLTWPYFVAVPYKLRDRGTNLVELGGKSLDGRSYWAGKLTFRPGVGDTPDDWYVVYADFTSNRLYALAYIITYGKAAAEAQKKPHAITYHDFVDVDGVPIATGWRFWHWDDRQGITGEPIGRAQLTNVRFVVPAADAFTRPVDARREELPQP